MVLLTNPKYRGYNQFYDSYNQYSERQDSRGFVTWEYYHHRIHGDLINPDLLKAVDILAAKVDRKSRENEFMLSGMLEAPNGSRYGGEFTRKKAYYYNRKIGSRFGSEHLHQLVMNRLKEYLMDNGLLAHLIKRMSEHKDFGLPKIRQERERVEAEIKKIEQMAHCFTEAIRSAAVEGEKDLAAVVRTLLQQKEQADQELIQFQSELVALRDEEERFRESFKGDNMKEYLKVVLSHFKALHYLEQKRVIRTLIPKGVIHAGKTENTLDLYVNLDPKVVPFPKGRGRPSSAIQPNSISKIYQFPVRQRELPAAAGAENKKGLFSYPALRGLGEEKWPYVRYGRGGEIRTHDPLLPKQVR